MKNPTQIILIIIVIMSNIQKGNTQTPDELIYEDLDGVNRQDYYKTVEKEILELCKEGEDVEAFPPNVVEEEKNKYVESYRAFYYTNGILAHNKSNEFFEEVIKDVHPTIKLKGPAKGLLKVACKVFVQELA